MKHNKPTIAITGASGFLGSELVSYFAAKDWAVIGLVRKPAAFKNTKNVSYVAYDITKPVKKDLLKGCDFLVHAAYIKQSKHTADALDQNVKGAQSILAVSRQHKLQRTVFISSMSAHQYATSTYGLQKLAIEKLFDRSNDVSLRSGLIIGNGGLVKQMADFMKSKHVVPLIGGGKQPLQTIGVYDLAKAVEMALTRPVTGILTVATPKVYQYKSFYSALGKRLNIHFIFVPIPYVALQIIIRSITKLRIPLSVNEDNLIGLKNLRSAATKNDLKQLGITVDTLETALEKTEING